MKTILSSLLFLVLSLSFSQHDKQNHSEHTTHTAESSSFAEKEAEVMPFSLEVTLHQFQDTLTGGIQKVLANDEMDQKNIILIREHLQKEAKLFAKGLFNDPSYLHGEEMAGLATLKEAGADGRLDVQYQDIASGGQITYNSEDPSVIIALHLWFQAQVVDHGDHASVGN